MATPKGLRAIQLSINDTDAVHVYSNKEQIWIQLRRQIPTERDIGSPSFKTAMCLSPDLARKLSSELLKAAGDVQRRKASVAQKTLAKQAPFTVKASEKQKTLSAKAETSHAALCPRCRTTQTVEHEGRQWCSTCGTFTTGRNAYPSPNPKISKVLKKPKVVDLISKNQNG